MYTSLNLQSSANRNGAAATRSSTAQHAVYAKSGTAPIPTAPESSCNNRHPTIWRQPQPGILRDRAL